MNKIITLAVMSSVIAIVGLGAFNAQAQTNLNVSEETNRKIFYESGLQNEELRQDLAEALHCELYTKCHMVYAGEGFIQIMIESGNEDDYREDFIGLSEAQEIQKQFLKDNQ